MTASRFGFARNPYRADSNAQAPQGNSNGGGRRNMSSDTNATIVPHQETCIVDVVDLVPADATVIGARISNFGVGGAYLWVYSDVKGTPATMRQGTYARRVSSTQAQKIVDDLKAKGMTQATFERDCITAKGEKYSRELVGMVPAGMENE